MNAYEIEVKELNNNPTIFIVKKKVWLFFWKEMARCNTLKEAINMVTSNFIEKHNGNK